MHETERDNPTLGLGELVLDASPDAVVVIDSGGRIVRLNAVAERLFGLDPVTSIGLELVDTIIPPALRERHHLGFHRYMTTGESRIVGQRVNVVGRHSSGRTFPVELTIVPLPHQPRVAEVPRFAGFLRDISSRERAEAGLRFLAKAGEILASSLDYEDTLRSVTHLAVPDFADWCIIDLLDDNGRLYRLVAAHADPNLAPVLHSLIERYPPDPGRNHPTYEVLRTGKPLLNRVVTERTWRAIAIDERHLSLLRELRPLSGLTVPLIARGRTLGTIEFLRSTPGWQFDEDDQTLGEEVARRAAMAVDNARLHHATEAALQGSEETVAVLETVLGTAPIGFAFIDTSFRYVRINAFLATINGATIAENIGRTVRDVRPRLADQIEPILLRVIDTGEPALNLEISGRPGGPDGRSRHLLASYYPIRTSDGDILGVGALVTDITERRDTEDRVRFLADASRLMAESLSYEETLASVARLAVPFLADWCLVYLLDETGAIRRLAIEHASPDNALARESMEQETRIDPLANAGVPQVIRTGESILMLDPTVEDLASDTVDPPKQQQMIAGFGVRSWICVPMIVHGETIGAISYMTAESGRRYSPADLALAGALANRAAVAVENARLFTREQRSRTDAEEAREQARRQAARLRVLAEASRAFAEASLNLQRVMDSVTHNVAMVLRDYCGLYLLDEDEATLTFSSAHHLNPDAGDYLRQLHTGTPQRVDDPLPALVLGPDTRVHSWTGDAMRALIKPAYRAFVNRYGVHSLMAVPLRVRGNIIGILLAARDQTRGAFGQDDEELFADLADRASLAIENARLFREAEVAARSREQFLSIASHELKTPITSVKAASQLLERWLGRGDLDLERIVRLNGQLRGEIDRLEMLVSDLLDASQIQQGRLELRRERVDLAALVGTLLPRFDRQGIDAVGHRILTNLEQGVMGEWDPSRLDQVVTNLLSNAIKYSPGGSEVRVVVVRDGDVAVLRVSDDGIGLSADDKRRLFQPFARADAVRQSIGGTGLGLFISRQIVENHGGSIEVESELGAGSTFIVRLPLERAEG